VHVSVLHVIDPGVGVPPDVEAASEEASPDEPPDEDAPEEDAPEDPPEDVDVDVDAPASTAAAGAVSSSVHPPIAAPRRHPASVIEPATHATCLIREPSGPGYYPRRSEIDVLGGASGIRGCSGPDRTLTVRARG
jgi:hypothetical protein